MNDLALPISTDITVFATNPREMAQVQGGMVEWCDAKIAAAEKSRDEFLANEERAAAAGWPVEAKRWHRQAIKHQRRAEFYLKLQGALQAGYLIVPPLPFEAFAIRTKRAAPPDGSSQDYWDRHRQNPQVLPAGEGEYRNPLPVVERESMSYIDSKTQKEVVTRFSYPSGWKPTIEFPFGLIKPQILDATNQAMALKVFDSIGILPGRKSTDPVVVGTILRPGPFHEPVHFFVAWWLDVETLR